MGRVTRCAGATAIAALAWGAAVPAAGADVIDPEGACRGSGTWQEGGFTESSGDHDPSDVIEIPQSDTVIWEGAVGDAAPDDPMPQVDRRDISGEVQVDLPVGTATIDDWGGSSERAANTGDHEYDLPDVLIGIEMTLSGEHREAGEVVCSGSVTLVVEGEPLDNPLGIAGLVGTVVFGLGLVVSGRGKIVPGSPVVDGGTI
jgi:hypothetical protein